MQTQHQDIQGQGAANPQSNQYPELGAPHLVLASPVGIAASTPGSTHIASGEHVALSSTGHTSVSAGKRLLASASRGMRFFVQSMGYRLIAAGGDIDIKALKDSINVLAKLNVTVSATRITISAKEELVINAGGSGTTYNAGGITHATSGPYKVHSADVNYTGPKSQAGAFPDELKPGKGNLELFSKYLNGQGTPNAAFEVEDALGRVFKGTLDAHGFAAVSGAAPGPASVSFGKDPNNPWDQGSFMGTKPWPAQAATTVPVQVQALAQAMQAKAQEIQKALQTAQAASQGGQQIAAAVQAGPKTALRTAGAGLAQMGAPGAPNLLKPPSTPPLAKSLTG
ncbi:hypothetical protein D3C72_1396500 [compost metagenome]